MLETIFAIIAIGLASPAGAAQLTIAEKLADIVNSKELIRQAIESQGVEVPSDTPLSQYGIKIGQITRDAGGFAATMCASLGSVNPAGGTFFSVHPFDVITTCRYTAPNKTVGGCSSVAANTVAYNGSSWPAVTYSALANSGYKVENNNTANPTCAQCAAGTSSAGGTSTSCANCVSGTYSGAAAAECSDCSALAGASPAGGEYSSVSPYNADTTCRYNAPSRNIAGCSSVQTNTVAYNGSSWPASTYSALANSGYKVENNNTANPTCTQCAAGTSSAGGASTSCANCAAGTYSEAGASACTGCANGTYSGAAAEQCSDCSALAGVSPAGGVYSSVSPYNANTTCRYDAPAKNIAGCATVTPAQVSYSGSAWPATTYAITANAGYYIANNNTASATCTSCAGACSASQSCTPTGCTVSNGTCVFTNAGTQTRSADCTNGAGNTSTSATCAAWGSCSAGTTKTVSCSSGFTPQDQGTANATCVASGISSGTSPGSCASYTSTTSVNENTVSGCSGGSAGGAAVTTFVVGGYCSATNGSGSYSSPQVQTCSSCSPATSQAGRYCYCKIHSINGTAVVASSRFVFYDAGSAASGCAFNCAYGCASDAQLLSGFRSALFSALGS